MSKRSAEGSIKMVRSKSTPKRYVKSNSAKASSAASWKRMYRQSNKRWYPNRWRNWPSLGRSQATPGLSQKETARLHYNEEVTVSAGTGAVAKAFFRANAAWDPQYSSGGHSAKPLSIWSAQFNKMCTEVSRIKVTPMNWDGPFAWGIYINDDNQSPYTTAHEYIECSKGDYAYVSKDQTLVKSCKAIFDARTYFNVKDIAGDDVYISTTDAVPAQECLFEIWADGLTDSTTTKVTFKVDIWYDNVFMERKDLPGGT